MKKYFILLTLIISTSTFASPFQKALPSSAPSGLTYNVQQPEIIDQNLFKGKRVAILISHGVQESEITYPYEYLKKRGATIDIVAPKWAAGKIMGVQYLKPTIWINSNVTFEEAILKQYDLLILTGGAWNSTVVRTDSNAIKLIQNSYLNGSIISAICAGSQILINAELSKGTNLTGTGSIKQDLINSGANYLNEPAVIDGNIVTGRGPADILEFMQAIHLTMTR